MITSNGSHPAHEQGDARFPVPTQHVGEEPHEAKGHGHGHGLMMIACCIPMLIVAGTLVATGAAGASAIVFALLCTAMMAAMMFAMPGHRH